LLIVPRVPFTNASSVPLACIQEAGPGSWPMWQKMLEISALRAAAPATPTRPSCTAPTAEQLDVANAVMEGRIVGSALPLRYFLASSAGWSVWLQPHRAPNAYVPAVSLEVR